MDDFGLENFDMLTNMQSESEKWSFIDKIASEANFVGIQTTTTLYEDDLTLRLNKIPRYIRKYRLTYHIGGVYELDDDNGKSNLGRMIAKSLREAVDNRMEDVSIHPSFLPKEKQNIRKTARDSFSCVLEKWLPKFERESITLSVETHVFGECFVFDGLRDYADFAREMNGLGVLIDVSHNCYDGYSENEIHNLLKGLKITGLHLSDAISGAEFRKGTHLPIGKGNVDFCKVLAPFVQDNKIYGALEIKSAFKDIKDSLDKLKNIVNN